MIRWLHEWMWIKCTWLAFWAPCCNITTLLTPLKQIKTCQHTIYCTLHRSFSLSIVLYILKSFSFFCEFVWIRNWNLNLNLVPLRKIFPDSITWSKLKQKKSTFCKVKKKIMLSDFKANPLLWKYNGKGERSPWHERPGPPVNHAG